MILVSHREKKIGVLGGEFQKKKNLLFFIGGAGFNGAGLFHKKGRWAGYGEGLSRCFDLFFRHPTRVLFSSTYYVRLSFEFSSHWGTKS